DGLHQLNSWACPSDPERSQTVRPRFVHNPNPSFSLWYVASIGPTHIDSCLFCPFPKANQDSPDSFCCTGWNVGTPRGRYASSGVFGRHISAISLDHIKDGTS